jgi:translation initiation factor 2 beta subunit (eIF-2beta)/eIF-5
MNVFLFRVHMHYVQRKQGEGEAAADGVDEFADLKKKKKKKDYNMEEFERELGDMSISKPKKKKEVKIADDEDEEDVPDGAEFEDIDEIELGDNPFAMGAGGSLGAGSADTETWLSSDRDYTYQEVGTNPPFSSSFNSHTDIRSYVSQLLNRFFRSLHAANPALALSGSKRYTLAPPSIHRDGNKRSVFANIGDICRRMHRQPEHVIAFMLAEMGTTGSVDGSGRLVIRGRFQQKQIENILRRYIGALSASFGSIPFELLGGYSGIRNVQNVQVARYPSHKGESDLLHGVRVLWVQAVRLCYQDGLPSTSWSEKEGSSVIIISLPLVSSCTFTRSSSWNADGWTLHTPLHNGLPHPARTALVLVSITTVHLGHREYAHKP